MSSKPPSDSKKSIKRRLNSNFKLTAEEFTKKVLFFMVENLISFDKVENVFFKRFLSDSVSEGNSFLPDPEVLSHLANEIYNDYQEYFKNYFKMRPNLKISISCHKWNPINEINPHMFVSAHYINENFRLCELTLSVFEFNSVNLSNFLIRDTVLKNFKNRLSFITTNYEFDDNSLDVLKFVTNETDISNKILMCFPSFLQEAIASFYTDLGNILGYKINDINNMRFTKSYKDIIPFLTQSFISETYSKFTSLSFATFVPLSTDKDNEYFDVLNYGSLKSEKSSSLIFLAGILVYKDQILELLDKCDSILISESDWDLVNFIVEFSTTFYEISVASITCNNPTSHMLLKWTKILIIHVTSFMKNPYIGTSNIEEPIANILKMLSKFHKEIEAKFDIIMSSYLHPSTKRYLKESDINKVNSWVGSMSQTDVEIAEMNRMDDMIMRMFDCSGKATKECYAYETSATSEIKYSKSAKYLTKESGSYILQFWNANQRKYSTLSTLSKETLSIQLSSERNYDPLKQAFEDLKKSSYFTNSNNDIQAIYFLHQLAKVYDLSTFDPKNLDCDIEDYRIDTSEYVYVGDSSSIFSDSRIECTDTIELSKRMKK